MDVWFEGLKADPDFSFKLTYTDSSGNQVAQDEVHADLVDWTYVDMNGGQIASATPVWKDSLIAAATAPDGPLLDPTGLDGEGSDASSDFFRASLLGLSTNAASEFQVASDDVSTDIYDEQLVSATDGTGGLEQKNPTVLYNGEMYLSTDDTPLTDDQRSQIQSNLLLDAVHNDGAKETLKTGKDVQSRVLSRTKFIQIILNKDVCNVGDVISGVAVAASGDSSWVIKVQTSDGQTFTGNGTNVLFSFTAKTAGYLTVSAVGGPATAPGGVPNPPNPDLPFSNAALIDVLPAGQTLPTWTQKAWDALHVSGIVPADPAARNRRITELYTTLFDLAVDPNAPNKLNPYEWYGIAAFVSNNAGNGMGAAFTYGFLPHLGAPDPQKVYQGLGQGNLAIFMDVYSQGLAYQAGGIGKINDMATANLIKPEQQQGWQLIDNGITQQDQSLIWSGVGHLANVEQTVTLQGVINTDYAFWSSISTSWTAHFFPLKSGVPGDTSDFNSWCGANPAIVGNSYNFALGPDRYQWFVNAILPAWQAWRSGHNSIDLQTLLKGGY